MTTPDRFRRVEEVFLAAKRLAPDERAAFVAERSGGDASIIAEVLDLLREDERSAGALDRPPLGRVELPSINVDETPIPESIGPFQIIALLGEGGMGAVYEAEQRDPRRRVAVKVIRPGLRTKSLLQRFRRETQALAQLSHPGIAQLYEVGQTTSDGVETPYFAMELVRGEPLLQYAAKRSLDARGRLRLLESIAESLQHAHERGVIHRDLKPTNILVDETGQTKILDFGVSRITIDAADETENTIAPTQSGVLLGTLSYMSPEQVGADPRAVDARSDVYSLGVIGYELLTGQLPYDVSRANLPESARTIRETEPTSLSSFSRALRGDVETIILKALAKEPSRRYQSAREFADDIQRHLSDEPIRARPASAAYQLSRFAKRNKPIVAGVAASFAVLLISLAVISALLVRTMRAERDAVLSRDKAAQQAAIAEEINAFLVDDLIAAVSPDITPDRDVTLVDLLDAASRRIDGRFSDQPAVEAALRRTIALTYWDLGFPSVALPHGERAVELSRQAFGEHDDRTLMAMANLGDTYRALDRLDDAEKMHSTVLARLQARPDREPSQYVMALFNLGSLRRAQGRFDEAYDLLSQASREADTELPSTSLARMHAKSGFAGLLRERGRLDEAIQIYESLNLSSQITAGIAVPDALRSFGGLALAYSSARRFEDSERTYREILAVQTQVLGDLHRDTIQTETNLCLLLIRMGRHNEAKQRLEVLYDRAADTLGVDHPQTLLTGFQLGKSLTNIGQAESAAILLSDLHARSINAFNANHQIALITRHELARALNSSGQYERAKELTDDLVERGLSVWPRLHEVPAYFMQVRADALAGVGQSEQALLLYAEAISILKEVDPENLAIQEMQQRVGSLQGPIGAHKISAASNASE